MIDHLVSELGGDAMNCLTALFWLSAACVFYTTVAYPLILAAAVRLRIARRPGPRHTPHRAGVDRDRRVQRGGLHRLAGP